MLRVRLQPDGQVVSVYWEVGAGAKVMRETVTVTAADGVKLALHRLGAGLPLYAIHGGPATDHRAFGTYLDAIASYRQLHLLDQRGCGDSEDCVPASYTLERLAQDIEEVRAHLAHAQIDVLGHSFGCIVALTYALRWPHRVRALVLVDGLVRGWRGILSVPGSWWLWTKTIWIGLRKDMDSNEFHLMYEVANADKQQQVGQLLASPRRFDPARVQRLSMAGARPLDPRPLLSAGVPVLGIFGKQDRRFVGEAGYLQGLGAKAAVIEGAGHFPFVERHEEFHQVLKGYLTGSDGSR